MDPATATRVLVVANRTAATPWLLQEIERRAKGGPCEFALLVPLMGGRHPDWTLDVAQSHVEQAAGRRVQTVECDRDYIGAVRRALREQPFDEVLVSMRPPAGPKWLNPHPMRWLEDLEVPVTTVMLGGASTARARRAEGSLGRRCLSRCSRSRIRRDVIHRIVPNLHVRDAGAGHDFYVDFLGLKKEFDLGWVASFRSPENRSIQVSLVSEDASAPEDSAISVAVDDVDKAYAEARRRGYEIVHPLTEEPWGPRRFFVRDPNGVVVNVVGHPD